MRNFHAASLIAVLSTALINAQLAPIEVQQQGGPELASADRALRFDVASVKLSVPGANPLEHRQLRNMDPGRIHYVNVGLKDIMMNAFNVKEYQITGPDWLSTIVGYRCEHARRYH